MRIVTALMVLSLSLIIFGTKQTALGNRTKPNSNTIKLKITEHRQATWHWQDIMLRNHTPTVYSERHTKSVRYLRWLSKYWYKSRLKAKRRAKAVPNMSAWLCIHSGEGSWTANTGNGYYGGLQMDMSFQRAHGWDALARWGTANNWPPLTQMWVAERARASGRGFYPWPNTARNCNLI